MFAFRGSSTPGARLHARVRERVPRQASGRVPHAEEHGPQRLFPAQGADPRHQDHHPGADGRPEQGPLAPDEHPPAARAGRRRAAPPHALLPRDARLRRARNRRRAHSHAGRSLKVSSEVEHTGELINLSKTKSTKLRHIKARDRF